jgi:Dna[CI] antecedent, DciA
MPELLERWRAAVGEAIARMAWPARIAKDGTVHVNTADSIWAFELGQQAREIAERLAVPRLRFAPGPLPEPDAEARRPALEPTPEDDERARALATAISDEMLRESVQKAVRLSLARERLDRPI